MRETTEDGPETTGHGGTTFTARLQPRGADPVHVDVQVFAGVDEDHLAGCGTLTLRAAEADDLIARLVGPEVDGDTVQTDGGVSARTSEPFVTVKAKGVGWQWSPGQAREFAVLLIRTAAAAEADADVLAILRDDLEVEAAGQAGFVSSLRERRAARP